nr:PD-(D/E)XK nuclease family protein [Thermosporothrix hazakensis]
MWEDRPELDVLDLSPTRVQGCARAKWLAVRKFARYLNPYARWHSLRGTLSHSFFEAAPPSPGVLRAIKELRLSTEVETWYGTVRFSGKPDLIEVLEDSDRIRVKITDWKSISDIPHTMCEAKKEHQDQINMYAWLTRRCLPEVLGRPGVPVDVDELEIVYFSMNRVRRFTSKGPLVGRGKQRYPRSSGEYEELELAPIELYPPEVIEGLIIWGVEEAIEARESDSPPEPLSGVEARLCDFCDLQRECVSLRYEK